MSPDCQDGRKPPALARLVSRLLLGLAAISTIMSFSRQTAPALADGDAGSGRGTSPAPAGSDPAGPHGQGPGKGRQASGDTEDRAPGDEQDDGTEPGAGHVGYLVGLGLAVLTTAVSFGLVRTGLVWGPSIPIAISVLAIAQMGVHLVFFLHIGSGPDSTNNIMALAFGVLIVFLLIAGSLWIMAHLNHNMMPMEHIMRMQR